MRACRIPAHRLKRAVAARTDPLVLGAFRRLVRRTATAGSARPDVDRAVASALRRLGDADLQGRRRSPVIARAVRDNFHRRYYHRARSTWRATRFLGVDVWKSPLDLWIYQELLHELRPDVLVEAGTKFGGSAWYFAHLMDLMGHGRVITIDVTAQPDRPEHPRITYLEGSSADPAVAAEVDRLVDGGRILVVLDSDHRARHVLEELRLWGPRVPVGSYCVVEDTHADGHPVTTRFGRGPWDAVTRFLDSDDSFEIDRSRHKFLMSFNRRGYLRRVR